MTDELPADPAGLQRQVEVRARQSVAQVRAEDPGYAAEPVVHRGPVQMQ
nr:hypothetical protein [Nonomuraea deserti]